jgi:thiol-disulfide isomerase/thioredoxin
MKRILLLSISMFAIITYILADNVKGFQRNVVYEEGTGTWCPWCVRGIVAMEYMQNKYPGTFIGIAVHNNDKMTVDAYDSCTGFISWPSCNVDRSRMKIQTYPSDFEDAYNAETSELAYGKIDVSAAFSEDQKSINVNTSSVFSIDTTNNYNVAIALVEDSVTGYSQKNEYAGGANGPMGGFEDKPSVITDQVFDHVARGIFPSYYGANISNGVTKSETYNYDNTIEIPDKVQHNSKLSVVALLLDANSGKIVNAAKYNMVGGINDNPNHGTGNDSIDKGNTTSSDTTVVEKKGDFTYIDLGLSVNWASGNILGASDNFGEGSQDAFGGYFGWADPTGLLTSSDANDYHGENPPSEITGSDYDLARIKWGGDWRIPTKAEMEELVNNTTTVADTINNVPGLMFTSTINGNKMFMPCNGSRYETSYWDVNQLGAYWTSTLSEDQSFGITAHQLDFDNTGAHSTYVAELYNGFAIRPVFSSTTHISNATNTNKTIVSTSYYDISGRNISKPSKGVCIIRTTYSDGTNSVCKKIFR